MITNNKGYKIAQNEYQDIIIRLPNIKKHDPRLSTKELIKVLDVVTGIIESHLEDESVKLASYNRGFIAAESLNG